MKSDFSSREATHSDVEQLLKLRSTEKGIHTGEFNATRDMVLNKPSQRVAACRRDVLVVGVANKGGFCTGYIIL